MTNSQVNWIFVGFMAICGTFVIVLLSLPINLRHGIISALNDYQIVTDRRIKEENKRQWEYYYRLFELHEIDRERFSIMLSQVDHCINHTDQPLAARQ